MKEITEHIVIITAIVGVVFMMFFFVDCTKEHNKDDNYYDYQLRKIEIDQELEELRKFKEDKINKFIEGK